MFRSAVLTLCFLLLPLHGAAHAATTATPRPGLDYEILAMPQATFAPGKIEVAEVFGYGCIHCARFQPLVNAWRKSMPTEARWQYVPAVFGGVSDNFARAYFASEILGVQPLTHDAVFKGVFEDKVLKTGSADEIAGLYAQLGVDRARFVNVMQSAGVTAKLARARQFAINTGITDTPTIILNGKVRIMVTSDRGFQGALDTLDYFLAKEVAASVGSSLKAKAAPTKSKAGV